MNAAAIAKAYYEALRNKTVSEIDQYLHADIRFIGPLAELKGKEAILDAARKFSLAFTQLTVRASFSSEYQVMTVYDLECPAPIGHVRAAALMDIHKGLIERIELFYDARPFQPKKEEIFDAKNNLLNSGNQ